MKVEVKVDDKLVAQLCESAGCEPREIAEAIDLAVRVELMPQTRPTELRKLVEQFAAMDAEDRLNGQAAGAIGKQIWLGGLYSDWSGRLQPAASARVFRGHI